jgi:hypothetical protein
VTGLPAGVALTDPEVNLCNNGPLNPPITLTVPPGTPQGNYPFSIEAFGSNNNGGSGSIIYIYPFLQVGSGGSTFSISTSPPQTTAPGGTAQYTVTVSGSAGLGNVTLTASGGPPGATVLLNGASSASVAIGGTATMTVATTSNAGLGSYSVPITGMLGTVPQYVTASVTIAASSPGNMLTPANGGFIFGGNTAFTWTPGVGATQYVLTVTPANAQSTSITVNPSSQPGATVALPTANQSVTASLLTYTPNGPLQSPTYTYIINPSPGSQLPLLNTALQQPAPYIPNNGIESQPYTYYFTGGDARAMGEGECVETDAAVRIVLLTQTTATLAFTGANGIRPQASALTCTCPGGGVPINPAPAPVDTTPVITGVTSPIQANLNQTIHITGVYFGDPAAGANDTVQICQNGSGACTSVAADLLDDSDILATVALSAGDYTVYVFSNGVAGSGFVAAPGDTGGSNGADLEVEAAVPVPTIISVMPSVGYINTTVTLTINGSGFGLTPQVGFPIGFGNARNQVNSLNGTQITITVDITLLASIGNGTISVSNSGLFAFANFVVNGPYYMVVQSDSVGFCTGCATTVQRTVTYQVLNFDKSPVGAIPLCEAATTNDYSCLSPSPFPGFSTTQCTAPRNITPGGMFSDVWSLGGDGYIAPTGAATCGIGVADKWFWAGLASFQQELGSLSGVVNTTQIIINGTLNMSNGTVIPH